MSNDSRIGQIRASLGVILTKTDGINVFEPAPPSTITIHGTAWVGLFRTRIESGMSGREIHHHTVPLTVVVNRAGTLEESLNVTEPVLENVLDILRLNQSLGINPDNDVMLGKIQAVRAMEYYEGFFEVGQETYIGFQIIAQIDELRIVQYGESDALSGGPQFVNI
jgi:hypothetical protein